MADAPPKPGPEMGLSASEEAALRSVLGTLGDELGYDFARVLDGLSAGLDLGAAIGLPEQTVDVLYSQAIGRFNTGDTQAAQRLFETLCALAPKRRDHWLGLGICQRLQGQLEGAQIAFDVAQTLAPQSAATQFHLCELACIRRDWPRARTHLDRFVALEDSPEKRRVQQDMTRLAALLELKSP